MRRASRLAEALSIHSVLVPPAPGNMSAMGLLCADVRHDLARTMLHRLTPDFLPRVRAVYDELLVEADAALASDGVPGHRGHVLQKKLFDNGLNLKTTGDCALIAPPLIAEKSHVDEIADILRKTVTSL